MSGADDWIAAQAAAREALASGAATRHLAAARFTPIDTSLSNFAWRVETLEQRCFVRLARIGSESLGADLQSEARILHLVSGAGLSPAVLRCDPSQRLLVTRWIEPVTSATYPVAAGVIESVARVLASLHRLAVPADLRQVRFAAQARMLRESSPDTAAGSDLDGIAAEVFARLDAARTAPVLCHHDVHAQNMVFDSDRRLWLVDWEYAGLNDPAFDLASFASQCALPADATLQLCAAYARAGGEVDAGRLERARWAFDYVQWLWYRGLHAQVGTDDGRGEAALRSNRIESSLRERASAVLRCNNRGFGQ